jgi:hypothetical protein
MSTLTATASNLLTACEEALRVINTHTTEPIPVGVYNRITRILGDAVREAKGDLQPETTPARTVGYDWVTDWAEIEDDGNYIVCLINVRQDGILYLGHPIRRLAGWEVKRLMPRCYAALSTPLFKKLPPSEETR